MKIIRKIFESFPIISHFQLFIFIIFHCTAKSKQVYTFSTININVINVMKEILMEIFSLHVRTLFTANLMLCTVKSYLRKRNIIYLTPISRILLVRSASDLKSTGLAIRSLVRLRTFDAKSSSFTELPFVAKRSEGNFLSV